MNALKYGINWRASLQSCKRCGLYLESIEYCITMDSQYSIEHKKCGIMIKGDTPLKCVETWVEVMDNWNEFKAAYQET